MTTFEQCIHTNHGHLSKRVENLEGVWIGSFKIAYKLKASWSNFQLIYILFWYKSNCLKTFFIFFKQYQKSLKANPNTLLISFLQLLLIGGNYLSWCCSQAKTNSSCSHNLPLSRIHKTLSCSKLAKILWLSSHNYCRRDAATSTLTNVARLSCPSSVASIWANSTFSTLQLPWLAPSQAGLA